MPIMFQAAYLPWSMASGHTPERPVQSPAAKTAGALVRRYSSTVMARSAAMPLSKAI